MPCFSQLLSNTYWDIWDGEGRSSGPNAFVITPSCASLEPSDRLLTNHTSYSQEQAEEVDRQRHEAYGGASPSPSNENLTGGRDADAVPIKTEHNVRDVEGQGRPSLDEGASISGRNPLEPPSPSSSYTSSSQQLIPPDASVSLPWNMLGRMQSSTWLQSLQLKSFASVSLASTTAVALGELWNSLFSKSLSRRLSLRGISPCGLNLIVIELWVDTNSDIWGAQNRLYFTIQCTNNQNLIGSIP